MIELVKKEEGVVNQVREFKSFYKVVGGGEGSRCPFSVRCDSYSSCGSDCKYCYAKRLLGFRGFWTPENPAVADIKKMERKLNSLVKQREKTGKPIILRLGGMADCLQPVEEKYKNTYNLIKLMNERDIHYLIVTKYNLIAKDEYLKILDKNLAHVQISVTSTDDNLGRQYEKATVMSKRIQAVEKLYQEGVDVSLRLSPLIEEFVNFDIINNIKCDKVLVEFLRADSVIKKTFTQIDYSKYTHREGNYYHLPLEEKIRIISKIQNFKEKSVCEDVSAHYEYWKENFNYNKNNCCNININI